MVSLEEQSVNKQLEENTKDAKELFNRGIEYFDRKEFDEAISFFTQAIQIDHLFSEAYFRLGECYKEKEFYDFARNNFDLAINYYIDADSELADKYCESYIEIGRHYEKTEEYNLAIECYTKIINFSDYEPSGFFIGAYFSRSRCYAKNNLYDLAIKDLDEAMSYESPCAESYLIRFKYNINIKPINYKSALDDLDKAIEYSNYPEDKNEIARKAFIICLAALRDTEKAKSYLAFINEKDKNIYLLLISEIKKSKEKDKQIEEKEKEMLSFFTHTMRNALATAPESLRQAIRLLGSEDYESNQKHYEAINEITALFSTLTLTDCLIDTFKQSIYDTEEFKRAWQHDNTGDASPEWFIAAALRQSLNRIIFMEDATGLRKLINNQGELIKPTRKAFIEQVLPLDVNQRDVEKFYHWLQSITAVEVTIEKSTVQFGANQIKFSLMFAISSELILNALKYWSGTGKIQINWRMEPEHYIFSVKNACKANASSQLAGTHKGLAFINRLIELLGEQAQFNCSANEHTFSAELKLHKTLLEG